MGAKCLFTIQGEVASHFGKPGGCLPWKRLPLGPSADELARSLSKARQDFSPFRAH